MVLTQSKKVKEKSKVKKAAISMLMLVSVLTLSACGNNDKSSGDSKVSISAPESKDKPKTEQPSSSQETKSSEEKSQYAATSEEATNAAKETLNSYFKTLNMYYAGSSDTKPDELYKLSTSEQVADGALSQVKEFGLVGATVASEISVSISGTENNELKAIIEQPQTYGDQKYTAVYFVNLTADGKKVSNVMYEGNFTK